MVPGSIWDKLESVGESDGTRETFPAVCERDVFRAKRVLVRKANPA